MWTFVEVVRIGQDFGVWYTLVTLSKGGTPESFFISFGDTEPDEQKAAAEGSRLALRKNLDEAPPAQGDSLPREAFLERFTATEFTRIYQAANVSPDVFMYVKKMEINPTVNRTNPVLIGGLQMLEQAGMLDHPGRAAEILGW